MIQSRKFTSADTEYEAIHDAWVENNRPSQFDITFQENLVGDQDGGAIFHVLDTSAAEPDFYMKWSRGPTTFDENSASERPTHRGWLLMNQLGWVWKMWPDREGKFKVQYDDAPNDLA